jgi:hypothetical protein
MDTNQAVGTGVRVLGPGDGEVAGAPGSRTDRFIIDGADTSPGPRATGSGAAATSTADGPQPPTDRNRKYPVHA